MLKKGLQFGRLGGIAPWEMAIIKVNSIDAIPTELRHRAVQTPNGWAIDSSTILNLVLGSYTEIEADEQGCVYLNRKQAKNVAVYREALSRAGSHDKLRILESD